MSVRISDVWTARNRLAGITVRTPILHDKLLTRLLGQQTYFKAESLQVTGSFKVRGAYNRISQLTDDQKMRGIIASSAGNHGLGVAFSALQRGIRATVVMPENAVEEKVNAIKAYGIEVVRHGLDSTHMFACMETLAKEHGYEIIHPFDDELIVAGQGTLGLELIEDCPEADIVLCGVSGGGLISGVATAVKGLSPRVQVIGVQPQGATAAYLSLQKGAPVTVKKAVSVADGLLARRPGDLTFEIMNRLVDDMLLVSEKAILRAAGLIAQRLRVVCEPSGAVGLAALLEHSARFQGKTVAVILSGGNVGISVMQQCLEMASM